MVSRVKLLKSDKTPPTKEATKHLPELDGLRGLAILGVMCSHGVGLSGLFRRTPNSLLENLFAYFTIPLWGGVDLFFVLSGFLITGILLRTKTDERYFQSFYARRTLRIFPIYYFALTLSLILGHYSTEIADILPAWNSWKVAYFLYVQNWPVFWHGEKIMGGLWGAYWSLAVEEQFYFLWPLVILHFSEKTVARLCIIGCFVALPLRILLSHFYFRGSFGLAQITSSRVDGLLLGAFIAIYMLRKRRPIPKSWIAACAFVGMSFLVFIGLSYPTEFVATGRWMTTIGITAFALLSGALVALSQHHSPLQRVLTLKWLRTVGKYSYGMYVYHLLLFLPVRSYLLSGAASWIHLNFPEKILFMISEIMAVFVVAKLSYDHFESRFLNLKRYFSPA